MKNLSDHHFYALYEKISELSSNFARPKVLTESFSTDISKDEEVAKNSSIKKADLENIKAEAAKPFILSSNVYLYRSSSSQRVFVPDRPKETPRPPSPKEWGDFIPLGDDISSDAVNLNETTKSGSIKTKRYMDFCEQIETLNETDSLVNSSSEIFAVVDTVPAREINKSSNNRVLKTGESSKKLNKIKKNVAKNLSYIPLKVKRMQGNNNRVKATKSPKLKKK